MFDQDKNPSKKYDYIIEKHENPYTQNKPVYFGPGTFDYLDAVEYGLKVEYLDLKEKNKETGLWEEQAHGWATGMQEVAKNFRDNRPVHFGQIEPSALEVMAEPISSWDSSNNTTSSDNSYETPAQQAIRDTNKRKA